MIKLLNRNPVDMREFMVRKFLAKHVSRVMPLVMKNLRHNYELLFGLIGNEFVFLAMNQEGEWIVRAFKKEYPYDVHNLNTYPWDGSKWTYAEFKSVIAWLRNPCILRNYSRVAEEGYEDIVSIYVSNPFSRMLFDPDNPPPPTAMLDGFPVAAISFESNYIDYKEFADVLNETFSEMDFQYMQCPAA